MLMGRDPSGGGSGSIDGPFAALEDHRAVFGNTDQDGSSVGLHRVA